MNPEIYIFLNSKVSWIDPQYFGIFENNLKYVKYSRTSNVSWNILKYMKYFEVSWNILNNFEFRRNILTIVTKNIVKHPKVYYNLDLAVT